MTEQLQRSPGDDLTGNPATWGPTIIRWLLGQGATVVVLIAILGCGIYGTYRAATDWIPDHLESIKAGYREIAGEYRKVREMEIAADKERYEDHKKTDAERYEWIRQGFLNLKNEGAALAPKEPVAGPKS